MLMLLVGIVIYRLLQIYDMIAGMLFIQLLH
ncbi:hypothetical protein ECH_1076 [Ehrlichia chaffeensis str. Arkansas]|uniref:Uncharacterized protein n=1 Tax=Ehrlichia chaffeensis (strain ATCC CRL-10679 / Arkansas) TaxID=205920 RepID=Q2GFC2_EHRCR|nr:hypothetical protein ECH_1076 [Ehrlichia chaffeensis str. Arkansas]